MLGLISRLVLLCYSAIIGNMNILCTCCGVEFGVPEKSTRKYCSDECRKKYGRLNGAYIGVCPGSVGAIAELAVSADLLSRGYGVFRSVSPNSSCDIVATKGNATTMIEVKSGHYNRRGNKTHPMPTNRQRFDVLAVYMHETKEIFYTPPVDPICKNPFME